MKRLYLQVYLAFLGVLLLFAALLALAWWLLPDDGREHRQLDGLAALLAESLPEQAHPDTLEARLAELAALRRGPHCGRPTVPCSRRRPRRETRAPLHAARAAGCVGGQAEAWRCILRTDAGCW
jgi:hypothetical protein